MKYIIIYLILIIAAKFTCRKCQVGIQSTNTKLKSASQSSNKNDNYICLKMVHENLISDYLNQIVTLRKAKRECHYRKNYVIFMYKTLAGKNKF